MILYVVLWVHWQICVTWIFSFLESHIKNMEFASPRPVITLLPLFCQAVFSFHHAFPFSSSLTCILHIKTRGRTKTAMPCPSHNRENLNSNGHLKSYNCLPDGPRRSGDTRCHHATEEAGHHLRCWERHNGYGCPGTLVTECGATDSDTQAEAEALSNIHELSVLSFSTHIYLLIESEKVRRWTIRNESTSPTEIVHELAINGISLFKLYFKCNLNIVGVLTL